MNDFDYLNEKEVYLDAACQSLRPKCVIKCLENYYLEHNSCGERVKYPWGEKTDMLVSNTRKQVLKFLKLSEKDYFVSFTLNTTYGINMLINSVRSDLIKRIITSEIEHNSPFLATMNLAKRLNIPRTVVKREENGEIATEELEKAGLENSLVVVNAAANFDGRKLCNIKEVIKQVHKAGGMIIIDAAQAMAHAHELLEKTEADAICFSAHKMYAPSLGVMVVRKDLVGKLDPIFLGGGMVDDVEKSSYILSAGQGKKWNPEHIHTILEPGLQAWGEIVALGETIHWLAQRKKADKVQLMQRAEELDKFLRKNPKIKMVNREVNPTMSFFVEGLDSHLLGAALGKEGVMARTGYFCAHYFLDKVCKYPPLIRFSLSYATRDGDIEKVKKLLTKL